MVGVSTDLGGAFEVDHEVAAVVESAGRTFAEAGVRVVAHPDPGSPTTPSGTLRAWHFQAKLGALLAEHPDAFKARSPTTSGPGRRSLAPTSPAPTLQRTALAETMRQFFTEYDVLVLPVSQVPLFPVEQEFPTAINGEPMGRTWTGMRSAAFITVTGCPAISPAPAPPPTVCPSASRSSPPRRDLRLLQVARAFEWLAPPDLRGSWPRRT